MKTILGNMVFSAGFEKADIINFCGKQYKVRIFVKAYYEKDCMTPEQEKALKIYWNKKKIITDKFTKSALKYDPNAARIFIPTMIQFATNGECGLFCNNIEVPTDESIFVVLLNE